MAPPNTESAATAVSRSSSNVSTGGNNSTRRQGSTAFRILMVLPIAIIAVGLYVVVFHFGMLNGYHVNSIKDLDSIMYQLIPNDKKNDNNNNNDNNIRKLNRNNNKTTTTTTHNNIRTSHDDNKNEKKKESPPEKKKESSESHHNIRSHDDKHEKKDEHSEKKKEGVKHLLQGDAASKAKSSSEKKKEEKKTTNNNNEGKNKKSPSYRYCENIHDKGTYHFFQCLDDYCMKTYNGRGHDLCRKDEYCVYDFQINKCVYDKRKSKSFLKQSHTGASTQEERKTTEESKTSDTTTSSKTERQTEPDNSSKKKKPLNIVLIYADDMRHDSIGIAGTQIVQTPNIDEMARQGIRFTHNCVTTSVCWISRATLYTGQYQSRHGNTMPFQEDWQKNWTKSWPYLLKNKGNYYQGHVGKWHHMAPQKVTSVFDFWRSYYGEHIMSGTNRHITKQNELDAIDFLKGRPKDKPFLLSVCHFAPHAWDGNDAVFVPQNSSMKLYKDSKGEPVPVPVPVSFTDEAWDNMPYFFSDRNEARVRFRQRFNEPDKFQHMMRNYYRLISEIDHSTGKIIGELKKQGVLDDTLIIFTTDNGFFHAEHAMAGKWYPHEESVRVPLVVRDPRIPKDKIGTTNDEFTLNIDLAETILGAAGLDAPDIMQGRDISDLYVEHPKDKSEWRKEFFYEHPMHLNTDTIPASTALVRKDFKYMLWPEFGVEQLFHLKNDPFELNDLVNKTEHAKQLQEMRNRHAELAKLAK